MLAADLKKLRRDVYSQNGEDGVVEWVFGRIVPRHRVCVEFGAWDGRNLSNTFNLVAHHGWKAVYIEADPRKFRKLQATASAYPGITPVCSLVATEGETSLDRILERHSVPADFDLLSIDVDGNDYDVWEAMTRFQPAMVIVEHNMSLPPEFKFVDRGGRAFMGSSAAAFTDLAARKGYGLLGSADANLFYLREPHFSALGVTPQSVAVLDHQPTCYVFFNYADEVVFSDPLAARKLRNVSYARRLKTWIRRLARVPTFYVLGDAHREGGAVLKLLRWIGSSSPPRS
ncbi:MAG: FkbM family methyltransferase [Beijerinckiaceae bacterium]